MKKKHLRYLILFFTISFTVSSSVSAKDNSKIKDATLILFERGLQEFAMSNYKEAIATWQVVLIRAEKTKNTDLQIRAKNNIGGAYNAMGYHKTALLYFIKTDKMRAAEKKKDESYWVNHINIAVCYMSLEQYNTAKQYFDATIDFNDHIVFLKYLNMAKWHADKKEESLFLKYKIKVDPLVNNYPIYKGYWEEVQLNYFTSIKNLPQLRILLKEIESNYNRGNLDLKMAFNMAYFLVHQQPYETLQNILTYEKKIVDNDNYYTQDLYYNLLKVIYLKQNNLSKYAYFSDLSTATVKAMNRENNLLIVEDFKTSQALNELKNKYTASQLNNNMITSELNRTDLLFKFTVILLILGLSVIFLGIADFIKSNKINVLRQIESENQLLKVAIEKIKLSEKLEITEEELNRSRVNIKKIMLLKKQLENLTNSKTALSDKESIKQIKLVVNLFFDNYRALTLIINKKVNTDNMFVLLSKKYPTLNKQELQVIEYILLQFTTKEIALLTNKTEKGIEYNRSKIRQKIDLQPHDSLDQYLSRLA